MAWFWWLLGSIFLVFVAYSLWNGRYALKAAFFAGFDQYGDRERLGLGKSPRRPKKRTE